MIGMILLDWEANFMLGGMNLNVCGTDLQMCGVDLIVCGGEFVMKINKLYESVN